MKPTRSTSAVLALTLLLLALSLGYFLTRVRHARLVAATTQLPRPGAEELVAVRAPAPDELQAVEDPEPVEQAPTPRERIEADSSSQPAAFHLRGTVLIEELDGTQTSDFEGELRFVFYNDRAGFSCGTSVAAGAFDVPFFEREGGYCAPSISARVHPLSFARNRWNPRMLIGDGEQLRVENFESMQAGFPLDSVPVILRARRRAALLLHVRDSDTGAELEQITLLHNRFRVLRSHPWAFEPGWIERRSAASPISLAGGAGRSCYFVSAPGHAWEHVEVDISGGDEIFVDLQPGGELEAELSGDVQRAGAKLRLRPLGSQAEAPTLELELNGAETLSADGLPVGDYGIGVELGAAQAAERLVLAEALVTIRAGERSSVRLRIERSPTAKTARLAGKLILPADWQLEARKLRAQLLGTALDGGDGRLRLGQFTLLPGTLDSWAWDAGEVQLGRYRFTYDPLAFSTIVQVHSEGVSDLVLELPPPVDVSVLLRDQRSGEVVPKDLISWTMDEADGEQRNLAGRLVREAGQERFEGRLPRSVVTLKTFFTPGYAPLEQRVDLATGLTEIVIEMRPTYLLEVLFVDGDRVVPLVRDGWPEVRDEENSGGQCLESSSRGDAYTFQFDRPGRYLVDFPQIPGYERPLARELVVGPGMAQELRIPLLKLP